MRRTLSDDLREIFQELLVFIMFTVIIIYLMTMNVVGNITYIYLDDENRPIAKEGHQCYTVATLETLVDWGHMKRIIDKLKTNMTLAQHSMKALEIILECEKEGVSLMAIMPTAPS